MNIIKDVKLFKFMVIIAFIAMLIPHSVHGDRYGNSRLYPPLTVKFRKLELSHFSGIEFRQVREIFDPTKSLVFEMTEEMKVRQIEGVKKQAVKIGFFDKEPVLSIQVRYPSSSEYTAMLGFYVLAMIVVCSIVSFISKWIYKWFYSNYDWDLSQGLFFSYYPSV